MTGVLRASSCRFLLSRTLAAAATTTTGGTGTGTEVGRGVQIQERPWGKTNLHKQHVFQKLRTIKNKTPWYCIVHEFKTAHLSYKDKGVIFLFSLSSRNNRASSMFCLCIWRYFTISMLFLREWGGGRRALKGNSRCSKIRIPNEKPAWISIGLN